MELTATPQGTEGTAFAATHAVVPGVWRYQILSENANGDGAPSPPTDAIRSRELRVQGRGL